MAEYLQKNLQLEFNEKLVNALDMLSVGESVIYEIKANSEEKILFKKFIDESDHMNVWYSYQRALISSLTVDKEDLIINYIKQNYAKVIKEDQQFPPDIIKCRRLFSVLETLSPSSIIEIGCGTSSHIISLYIESMRKDIKWATIDNDKSWLETTSKKIDKNQKKSSQGNFIHHENTEKTISIINKQLNSAGCRFIYLDAILSKDDKYQGLDILINAELGNDPLYLMIDARVKAVKNLDKLADKLGKNIQVMTNVVLREPKSKSVGSVKVLEKVININSAKLIALPTFYTLVKLI